MRRLRKLFSLFALCLALTMILPMSSKVVYAAEEGAAEDSGSGGSDDGGTSAQTSDEDKEVFDSGDAIQDIMTDSRFKGAISSISKITEFIDVWFVRIISLVSFFIISAAMLKNACAGAYCANSKFWDKVADAHQKTEAITLSGVKNFFAGGQGVMNTSAGGIRDFLLGLIPNIKAFTDFDDADIEPKAYFMKAIPQMIACVIIGIFIYNGYYRDTAATVGEMGSVLIERTLNSVNPDSFINKIFNTTGWPKSPWDKDKSREGKWKQSVFKEMKSLVASNYPDITSAQQKAAAVTAIVQDIERQFGEQGLNELANENGAGEGYIYNMSGISSYVSSNIGEQSAVEEDGTGNKQALLVFDMNIIGATTARTSANDTAYVSFVLKTEVDDGATGKSNVAVDGWGATGGGDTKLELKTDTVDISLSEKFPGQHFDASSGKVTFPSEITVSTFDFTETKISGIDNHPGGVSCTDSVITMGAREYNVQGGKIALGNLRWGSNKGSGTSDMVYIRLVP